MAIAKGSRDFAAQNAVALKRRMSFALPAGSAVARRAVSPPRRMRMCANCRKADMTTAKGSRDFAAQNADALKCRMSFALPVGSAVVPVERIELSASPLPRAGPQVKWLIFKAFKFETYAKFRLCPVVSGA